MPDVSAGKFSTCEISKEALVECLRGTTQALPMSVPLHGSYIRLHVVLRRQARSCDHRSKRNPGDSQGP